MLHGDDDCDCVFVRRRQAYRRRWVCRVLYLDLYWSRAVSSGVPVYACVCRRVVDAMDSLLNCAAPGLLVYNNIVVDATFKLTKINRLHLTITHKHNGPPALANTLEP